MYLLWTSRHCSCPSVCDFLYPLTLPRNLSPQMKTFLKECSRWERVRLPKNHHQVNLFAGHWPLDSRSREPISHQEKSSSGVFSAMIAPPRICLKNVPAHLIERELGARRDGMQPRTPQLSQSTCLPLSQMRKILCQLTDVKIRQFTNEEFRSGLWKA